MRRRLLQVRVVNLRSLVFWSVGVYLLIRFIRCDRGHDPLFHPGHGTGNRA